MEITTLLLSIGAMGGLGALFSSGLSLADKKLRVEEDPRIAQILELLPGANCGGCGYAGCANFAENVVLGKAEVSGCPVCDADAMAEIGAIMGVEVENKERLIARVFCQGGIAETARKGRYLGIQSCLAASLVAGGEKLCDYGCIGYGDCVNACTFDAMFMNDNGLPLVIDEKCTGCGNCVDACPRGVIELHPESHRLFVLCRNHDNPKESRKVCTRACIGCGICLRAVDDGKMVLENNLAIINYETYGTEPKLPTDKCSTECLVVIDNNSRQALSAPKVA